MFFKLAVVLTLLVINSVADDVNFTYNGFQSTDLSLQNLAVVSSNGLLKLASTDYSFFTAAAFYKDSVKLKNSTNGTAFSFSTTFVFAIVPDLLFRDLSGHGMAFVISPTQGLPYASATQYLGLFNYSNNGDPSNHIVAVELDTFQNEEFEDIDDNHVGVDVNGLKSVESHGAGYYVGSTGQFRNLTLPSGRPMQVWVEYDNQEQRMNVTLAPINVRKPKFPLLSLPIDLSPIVNETVYLGFSSATGRLRASTYILGWSFMINGQAKELDISKLPKLPGSASRQTSKLLTIGLPLIFMSLVYATVSGVVYLIKRKRKFADVVEDWECEYGPQRFKYKDLYMATQGFRDKGLLGTGGFGKVYKGTLPTSRQEIAVKIVSHGSGQGMKEFIAEIVCLGRLRHRNLVRLLGYCRRKGEMLLVYEYLPNGSLDKYLYGQPKVTLNWGQRFRVIKGVASGLLYLHEEWEQIVIHRDVKASNVLLDGELNARLGDFGLARLYDHGTDPHTTHVAGTRGYLAPEYTRTGKATTRTDLFAFGAFLLEVACGRRPIEPQAGKVVLVDEVFSFWQKGKILDVKDPKLGTDFAAEEVELVLKLGMLCSHSNPVARPSMRQVMHYLEGDIPLPDISLLSLTASGLTFAPREGSEDAVLPHLSLIVESVLSGGR
ncbi:hypothetical protein SLEP1_g21458 [Rubroshorea leprosula]|uniref:non-specific serine/threonine protein kinase n=1 Tax=Rubroshorea leprosula TaxID=152421 RepID=A0AAV5J949_9ROSI|nr:hypothetical protein SLEP1_g21458 [Rubroshorea leprosula]